MKYWVLLASLLILGCGGKSDGGEKSAAEEAAQAAEEMAADTADAAKDMADKAGDMADSAADKAGDMMDSAADMADAQQMLDVKQDVGHCASGTFSRSISGRPEPAIRK